MLVSWVFSYRVQYYKSCFLDAVTHYKAQVKRFYGNYPRLTPVVTLRGSPSLYFGALTNIFQYFNRGNLT
jgi:hypothetical protein